MHSLKSQFVSGFIGTGYLLFGRNHLVIFILVSVPYVFSMFYNIFRFSIFVAFSCAHSMAFWGVFSAFLADIFAFSPYE